ncbi:hypothetical protein D1906_22845 [Escherichia coli]|nr:hypothetical protein D1906_22845 [Escherichia coli]
MLIFILNCVAVQSGYIYHHTIICFLKFRLVLTHCFPSSLITTVFLMYLRMASFDVLTDLVDGGVINKTFAVIKNGNVFN